MELCHAAQVPLGIGELDLLTPHRNLGLTKRGARLIARRLVQVSFDLHEQLSGPDLLPLHHGETDDLPHHLGRDLYLLLWRDLTGGLHP